MAPTGSVTFISKAWGGGGGGGGGGRVSDKVITQNFGFLNMIEGGDLVLVDRGFNIEDEFLSGEQSLRFLLSRKEKSSYLQERLKSPAR